MKRWLVLLLLLSCFGCFSTSITVRVPKDVAMVRAFGKANGEAGKSLDTWIKESKRTERYQAVGDTIADCVGYICSAISPFTVISTVSAHWARVVEACNDADSFKFRLSEDKKRIKSMTGELSYDERDKPRFKMTVELYEAKEHQK